MDSNESTSYALDLANGSHEWYRIAAIRSRRYHRASAAVLQMIAASIPVSAVMAPTKAAIPAVLGAAIVVISSLRSIYHWHENYLRFSGAREAVEAQRRLYHTRSSPYDDPEIRDGVLAEMITRIEQDEMAGWIKIASEQRASGSRP